MSGWDYILDDSYIDELWDSGVGKEVSYPTHLYKLDPKSKTQEKKDNKMVKDQLYQVKDTELFGKIIATNSAGKKVVEIMGSGEVKLYDMNQLEKVIPYTVSIRFTAGGKNYNYLSNKGDFEMHDLLVVKGFDNNLTFAQVVGIDTKSEMADKFIEGYKLSSTKIKGDNF